VLLADASHMWRVAEDGRARPVVAGADASHIWRVPGRWRRVQLGPKPPDFGGRRDE
jgi:muconolactone delta-isomerase